MSDHCLTKKKVEKMGGIRKAPGGRKRGTTIKRTNGGSHTHPEEVLAKQEIKILLKAASVDWEPGA